MARFSCFCLFVVVVFYRDKLQRNRAPNNLCAAGRFHNQAEYILARTDKQGADSPAQQEPYDMGFFSWMLKYSEYSYIVIVRAAVSCNELVVPEAIRASQGFD